jgi:hypothetical protein
MKINKYIIAAAIAISVVVGSYVFKFYITLNYGVSNDSGAWAQLGDYVGGLLNPILGFISLVLLIKSLNLQNEANTDLRKELKNNDKTERIRSFEAQLFNMINSQKSLFDLFKAEFESNNEKSIKFGAEAVIEIENEIEKLRLLPDSDASIKDFLQEIDSTDQVFSVTRVFYIMVKMVSDKLSEQNGFSTEDRTAHINTLINFTDFSLLRLIMISMQFMDYHSVNFLKNDKEFQTVLNDLGLSYNLY